ncbi:MAG: PHP domain-containing protein, partial [Eubacterium ventriosum]
MNNLEKKKFFDVFPALKLNDNLQAMFEEVYVTRVSSNMSHDKLRVYIESSRLIEKSAIFTVRDEIIRNLRMGKRIGIEIVEKYHLSQQYTVENLLDAYKESIVMELGVRSPIVSTMFKKAPIRWDGNKMIIDLEANIISESRMKILKDTVERIFANRFEMPIEVVIDKKRFETNRFAKQNARRLQNEVEVLLNRDNGPKAKKEEKKEEAPKPVVIRKASRSDNPEVVYGRDFKFESDTNLCDVFEGTGECTVKGQIMTMDERETKTGKFIVTLEITDFTDSIAVKMFLADGNVLKDFKQKVKKGSFVRIKGVALYDTWDKQVEISRVDGMKSISPFATEKRKDTAVDKRIELHCHTKMSDMDGVSECKKIVRRAYEWGHKAIAITDHGVVQAFPDAWHEYEAIEAECEKAGRECDFKVIYGVEAYLVDDLKDM